MHIYIFVIIFTTAQCLDLRKNGVFPNYYASSIAIYKNRAFIALSRNSCYSNITTPTLIEASWNGNNIVLHSGKKLFFKQIWGKCDQLQNVVSLDVEVKKARLWILDEGNKKCPPKLLIYNLYGNYEVHVSSFYNFANEELSYLSVDALTEFGTLCYITFKTSNNIIVFSLNNLGWCVVSFNSGPIHPHRIAISKSNLHLYLTADNNDELLALNLSEVRNIGRQALMLDQKLGVAYVGKKLGPSTGIVIDVAGGLNYYLPRDYAVVRWDINKPLSAEHHDVLLQSYGILPHVSHLFNDPHNNVWALVNPVDIKQCTKEDSKVVHEMSAVSRVVQLSKCLRRGLKVRMLKLL
ncbi:hypothetical protein RN001_014038 [Aquatica leii]|uniref:Uncharacterized protein n=1 Tax=Aquatica leii TaxID=1421715 RepID=A0AAN7SLV3_9COLE|nr:hypothetical protein RN001_014038 [Aquatica leii]